VRNQLCLLPVSRWVLCLAHSSVLKMEAACYSAKLWLTFNGLHGVVSQKMELVLATAMTVSNHTNTLFLRNFR
jgi:hypothetical protein